LRTETPRLLVRIKNYNCTALLDTGASVSLISETLVSKCEIENCNKRVFDASGNIIPILGKVKVNLKTPGGNFLETLIVCSEKSKLTEKILLGMNILKKAKLDFPSGKIQFIKINPEVNDESPKWMELNIISTNILNENPAMCVTHGLEEEKGIQEDTKTTMNYFDIHLLDDLELKENSVVITMIKSPERLREGMSVVLHSFEHKKYKVVVANTVTKVNKGHLIINLINLNDNKVTLKH